MTDRGADALVADALLRVGEQRTQLNELERLLAAVPGFVRDSALGAASSPLLPSVELVHGPERQWEFWQSVVASGPTRPVAVFPEFRVVLDLVLERLGVEESRNLGNSGLRTRLLTAADQLSDPVVLASIGAFAELGIEIRTAESLPGFFLVNPDDLAVLPLEWGQALPSSLLVTRDPSLVGALEASFEDLWEQALPLPTAQREWDQVLRLMAQGMTDGSIGVALGLSLRSVRRRIADASEAYGADSRFALGVQWARRRR